MDRRPVNAAFGKALRRARKHKRLIQEDFSEGSSRTYVSTLERGLKSPTLEKIDELAGILGIHPLVLLVLTYEMDEREIKKVLSDSRDIRS